MCIRDSEHLTHRRVVRQLVRLDVPAGRQPLRQLAVQQQQDPFAVDDEGRDREVACQDQPRGGRSSASIMKRFSRRLRPRSSGDWSRVRRI